ncbi:MAG: sugar kinase [Candidatus Competibacteraceae bacterium]|nr:sugar kinase [Candidatus Competibacteraceae bacterium]MBK7982497.1 sugar kinase [Candidatus Competibacteraceae bacterium]MBK8898953.1 sugar kinase [Candidatus Competibacteraceae bacterium]MBK8963899.1 sugar kinase [Candidatus Competibacteraceae bacterium]MBK9951958.1 sugar kinase [Candidatus Competibacteraceae bacterium]
MTSPRRIVLFGECMIELRGQVFGTMQQRFGGDTLNTAIYLARLRADKALQVSYATALGVDVFSDHMIAAWRAEGIDTSLVRLLDNHMPGLYAIQVDASGERHFFYWRDTSTARDYFDTASTPLEDAIGGVSMLYLSGISLAILPAEGRERLLGVMARVRANGGQVAFDNNFRPRLWPDLAQARALYDRAYALSDLVLITLDDEMALRGATSADQALADVLALAAAEVVVKRGVRPTLVRVAGSDPIVVPVEPVDPIVDTTAAGDSFAGGYLAMRLSGVEPAVAARAANRTAAAVIQHPGAIIPTEAMPTSAALLAPASPTLV